jgi:hypothetical protein
MENWDELVNRMSLYGDPFCLFNQVIERLLSHDCIVTFESDGGRCVIQHRWNGRPCTVSATSDGLSGLENTINTILGVNTLHTSGEVMHELQ